MKKYIIAGVLVIAFIAYLVFSNKNSTITPMPGATGPSSSPSATGPTSLPPTKIAPSGNPPTTGNPPPTGKIPTATVGQYKNGTYTGTVADAFYGKLQAVAIIKGGALVDVQFPQYPTNGHSGQVAAFALPALKQEAIAAQSANVNVVSGATQDSQAFQQSLASALAQAKS